MKHCNTKGDRTTKKHIHDDQLENVPGVQHEACFMNRSRDRDSLSSSLLEHLMTLEEIFVALVSQRQTNGVS